MADSTRSAFRSTHPLSTGRGGRRQRMGILAELRQCG